MLLVCLSPHWSKAFDIVSLHLLLDKLYKIVFRGPFIPVLGCFSTDSRHMVSIDVIRSSTIPLKAEIPKGLPYRPCCFICTPITCLLICPSKLYHYDDTAFLSQHIHYITAVPAAAGHHAHFRPAYTQTLLIWTALKPPWSASKITLNLPLFLHSYTSCAYRCYVSYWYVKHLRLRLEAD